MFLFILGRQPEIGVAELRAVFGAAELILPNVARVATDATPDIDILGGTRKVGRVIWEGAASDSGFERILFERLSALPAGKITLGVSCYGSGADAKIAMKTALSLKQKLGRSVRVLPNAAAEISDAATLGNRLGTTPHKVELMLVRAGQRLIIAELIGVQNLNAYTFRDRSRPKRDARVGMLPPKLAQIMINLARADDHSLCAPLLDPFCGTGVVLQEAALMGVGVYGSDIEPRMIEYSGKNLDWLARTHHVKFDQKLEVGDATTHTWQTPIGAVVSETYLGQPYTVQPAPKKLRQNMATCNLIIEKFLGNIAPQLTPGTPLCLAVPVWFTGGKIHHLPITSINSLPPDFEYRAGQKPLIYRRENQIVGRELLVLARRRT
ncbi:MAG: hypothetical protein LBC95_00180 [Candidatus Nomurabacteria bacterium]|nr:hypothetical protein [Candidatus Nomurabacteria bacterium]